MASPAPYQGPVYLNYSKYASPLPDRASPVTSSPSPSRDTQLAIAHGDALKSEVTKHTAKFANIVPTTVNNTSRLLQLIRETSPDVANVTVDALWKELQELHTALNDAKAILPTFLEKQRNNLSLYHSSMMNQVIRDTQNELDIQHKKVNIQHNLILEHEQAFQTYKEQTGAQLQDVKVLEERVSRLTLEKGNLRTELDKCMQQLKEERSAKAELACDIDDSKKQLLAEMEMLRKQSEDDHNKVTVAHQVNQGTTEQLQHATDRLTEQIEENTKLQAKISVLEERRSTAILDAEKAKKENKALNEKYGLVTNQHAIAFTKLNEQTKEIDRLKSDIGRFQKDNAELEQRLTRLAYLEGQIASLEQANSKLSEQVNSLMEQLKVAQDEGNKAKIEREDLSKKVGNLDKEVEHKGPDSDKIASLEAEIEGWKKLGMQSYKTYQSMLSTYNQAEEYKRDASEKAETIERLKSELSTAKSAPSNDDASYWKKKYEGLLASISA